MPQIQASRSRLRRRYPILRPLTLTVALALAACGTQPQEAGSRASTGLASRLTPDQSEATLIKVADSTRAGGDFATAVGLYRRAHEVAGQDPVPLARLGETLAQMQSYTEAAEAYQAALALSPDDADLHRGMGNVLLALGKPQLALSHLEIAVAKKPDDPRIYNALGVAHDLAGRHDLALQDYRRGLSLAPDQLSLRNNLGLSQALAGDYNGAISTLSELVSRPGATARNRQNLALVYGLAGDTDHAASVARTDLDESAVRNNLSYYTLLRSLDDVGRTAAILGADVRAARSGAEPASTITNSGSIAQEPAPAVDRKTKTPAGKSAASDARTPTPAPMPEPAPVAEAPLPQPPAPEPVAAAPVAPAPAPEPQAEAPAPEAASAAPVSETPAPVQVASSEPVRLVPSSGRSSSAELASVSVPPAPAAVPPARRTADAGERRIVVQVGSFQVEANAHKALDQVAGKGFKDFAIVHDHDRQGREWWAVRTGTFSDEAATALARDLHKAGEPAIVVRSSCQMAACMSAPDGDV
ncbi:MAG: tetratricopeptide repeat protein, partial [Acidobacteriota bacterium]